jgi:transcriptional regulator with XRE-family HTH domain
VRFDELFSLGVAEARKQQRLTQEDLARLLRYHGLAGWRTGSVGQLEAGLRRPRLEEAILICAALGVSILDLLPAVDEAVELGDGAEWPHEVLLGVVTGTLEALPGGPVDGMVVPGEVKLMEAIERSQPEHERITTLIQPVRSRHDRKLTRGDVRQAFLVPTDPERHAAKRLGVDPALVKLEARRLWRRDFGAERDARLGTEEERDAMEARTLQARRGLVTRDMLAELRAAIDEDYGTMTDTKEGQ